MLKRLQLRIIAVTMLIVTAMLCAIFGLVLHFSKASAEQETIATLEAALDEADSLRSNSLLGEMLGFGGRGGYRNALQTPYLIACVGNDGVLKYAISNSGLQYSKDSYLIEISEAAMGAGRESGELKEYGLHYLRKAAPDGMRIAFIDIISKQEAMRSLVRSCVAIGLASLLIFLLIAVLFARWAVRPVEKAWKQQTQFVADASHELKTPLTIIATNVDLLQSSDCTDEQRALYTSNISKMSRQMRTLVERLLTLSRADNGTSKVDFAELNLSDLVVDALLPFEPVFFERGCMLEADIAEGVHVTGSADQLRQVVEILLENALKYGEADKPTSITLKRVTAGKAELSVESYGEQIAAAELEKLFERFYRSDAARATGEGHGLGLSIAKSITQDHKGSIHAESGGGKNKFVVELPCR